MWLGTAGAVALLLRRKWAVPLHAVSLVAVLLPFGWSLLASPLNGQKGVSFVIFPLIVIAVAAFSLWWAARHARRGTLR